MTATFDPIGNKAVTAFIRAGPVTLTCGMSVLTLAILILQYIKMASVDTGFLVLFVILLFALSIVNFIDKDKTLGRSFFALIYLIAAILLVIIGLKNV
jgi:hypothetical protein